MQLAVPWRRGQSKAFGSIPRINRSHPLAQGLVFYGYDAGGPCIDLVAGSIATKHGTAMSVTSSRYGNANVYPNSGTYADTTWPNVNGVGALKTLNPLMTTGGTGVFSYGVAYCITALPTTNTEIFAFGDAAGDGFGLNFHNSVNTDVGYTTADFQSPTSVSGLNSANVFHTMLSSSPTSGSQFYYFDGVQVGSGSQSNISGTTDNQPVINTYQVNSGGGTNNGITGQVYWCAVWNRALSASESLLLHLDPYCILIYSEDEIFAQLVGVAAAGDTFANYQSLLIM